MRRLYDILRLILCWHAWGPDLARTPPVGMGGQKCTKCPARRTVYVKGNST
jgi:hypothetical protein